MKTKTFTLTYPWDKNGYKPEVTFYLDVDEAGFHMHIVTKESNPRRVETKHQNFVHPDSCVEWFANFFPEGCDRYFNFEVNANGTMLAAFRKNRSDKCPLAIEEIESLGIQAEIHEDTWEIRYTVPFALLKKYIPDYEYREGMTILCNFYKCGDETEFPHYGLWSPIDVEEPDFHRPEFFGEVVLD